MKIIINVSKQIIIGGIMCFMFLNIGVMHAKQIHIPEATYGRSILKGEIISDTDSIPQHIELRISGLISESTQHAIPVSADGSFYFETNVLCIAMSAIQIPETYISFYLIPSEETEIQITLKQNKVHDFVFIKNPGQITMEDMKGSNDILYNILMTTDKIDSISNRVMMPNEYRQNVFEYINYKIDKVQTSPISEIAKQTLSYELITFYLHQKFLKYKEVMTNKQKKNLNIIEPDSTYYNLLCAFNLNDPQYLYSNYLSKFLDGILDCEYFGMKKVSQQSANEWPDLKKLQNSLGFDSGLFLDLLIARFYIRQMEAQTPLTDTQKKNILAYYHNNAFPEYLIAKNEYFIKMFEQSKVKTRTYPNVPKEQIMQTIIGQYKESVVFVDFWATWCGPCIVAMEESKPVKEEMKGKDVVFVYITDSSSPKGVWSQRIQTIEGEHYYLETEIWDYLWLQFDIKAIPFYLVYDKKGMLRYKSTDFMGKEKMKEMLEELLR